MGGRKQDKASGRLGIVVLQGESFWQSVQINDSQGKWLEKASYFDTSTASVLGRVMAMWPISNQAGSDGKLQFVTPRVL